MQNCRTFTCNNRCAWSVVRGMLCSGRNAALTLPCAAPAELRFLVRLACTASLALFPLTRGTLLQQRRCGSCAGLRPGGRDGFAHN